MWCGQHPAEEEHCLEPAGECEWFLQYQLKMGALPSSSEPCPGEGSGHRVSALMLCVGSCTHTPPQPPPEPFPTYWSGLKRIFFDPYTPVFLPDPLPGDRRARSISPRNGGSYQSSHPPPQSRSHKGACSSVAFLLPVSREQLCRKDAENPCEAPRKRY